MRALVQSRQVTGRVPTIPYHQSIVHSILLYTYTIQRTPWSRYNFFLSCTEMIAKILTTCAHGQSSYVIVKVFEGCRLKKNLRHRNKTLSVSLLFLTHESHQTLFHAWLIFSPSASKDDLEKNIFTRDIYCPWSLLLRRGINLELQTVCVTSGTEMKRCYGLRITNIESSNRVEEKCKRHTSWSTLFSFCCHPWATHHCHEPCTSHSQHSPTTFCSAAALLYTTHPWSLTRDSTVGSRARKNNI